MSNRFQFNLQKLWNLPPAAPGCRDMYHDTKYQFLKCRVSDQGNKSLVISARFGDRAIKRTVHRLRGPDQDPTMESLRKRARDIFQELEDNPAMRDRRSVPTFGEYVEIWIESADMRNVTEDWRHSKISAVRRHCTGIMNSKLDEIGRADIRALLNHMDKQGYVGMPRIIRSIINQVFELAIDDGVIPEDHPVPIPRNLKLKRNKRERRLTDDELARIFKKLFEYEGHDRCDADFFRLVVLLALFTAQRRGNILSMRWDEIDVSSRTWTIPASKAKTRRVYRIGLNDTVWQLLQNHRELLISTGRSGPWVFPSYADLDKPLVNIKRSWAWLVKEAELEDFRFHDLRHSAASIAYESSQDLKGTQLFLQHADSRTTADRYIHTTNTAPQVRASDAVVQALCTAAKIDETKLCGIVREGMELDGDENRRRVAVAQEG